MDHAKEDIVPQIIRKEEDMLPLSNLTHAEAKALSETRRNRQNLHEYYGEWQRKTIQLPARREQRSMNAATATSAVMMTVSYGLMLYELSLENLAGVVATGTVAIMATASYFLTKVEFR